MALEEDDDKGKRALLLHYFGERLRVAIPTTQPRKFSQTILLSTKTSRSKYLHFGAMHKNMKKLWMNTSPNSELRRLTKHCNFGNEDKEILTQIIQHGKSNLLRSRALREPDKSLAVNLDLELAESHAATMKKEFVKQLERPQKRETPNCRPALHQQSTRRAAQVRSEKKICYNCDGEFPHTGACVAKEKVCRYSQKPNHLQKMCLKWIRESVQTVDITHSQQLLRPKCTTDTIPHRATRSVVVISGKCLVLNLKVNDIACQLIIETG